MEPVSEAERRLGLEYINIAAHGVKRHPGRRLSENRVLVLFSKGRDETIAALWDTENQQAVTSETLPFGLGMLWDWVWRAQQVEQAFERLALCEANFEMTSARCCKNM